MKTSEFRKLIREEIRKVLREDSVSGHSASKEEVMKLTAAYGWDKNPKYWHIIDHAPQFTKRIPKSATKVSSFEEGYKAVIDFAESEPNSADPVNLEKLKRSLNKVKELIDKAETEKGIKGPYLYILFSEKPGEDLALGVGLDR